jgi:hypothetical protein
MISPNEGVKFSVHDGAVYVSLDDVCVHIPPHLVNISKVLLDALSSVSEAALTSNFTLAAPKEWLQAWVACFVREEERLDDAEISVLVNCLQVCIKLLVLYDEYIAILMLSLLYILRIAKIAIKFYK